MSEDANRRAEVASMYPGKRWTNRVMKMSDAQVFAIWTKKRNQEAEKVKKPKPPVQDQIPF